MTVQAILEYLLYVLVARLWSEDTEIKYFEGSKVVNCQAIWTLPHNESAASLAYGEGETHEAALNAAIIYILDGENGRWFTHRDVTKIFLELCEEDFDMVMDQPFCMKFMRKFTCSDPKQWKATNWPG